MPKVKEKVKEEVCSVCNGLGVVEEEKSCPKCGGKGKV